MRFTGEIAGLGSTSGVRVVVGMWFDSPLGTFTDVMLQQVDGHRVLLAPTQEIADLIGDTYNFDEVVIGPVELARDGIERSVTAPGLALTFSTGGRPPIGLLLALLPRSLATWPRWLRLIDPLAQLMMRGVRTRGSATSGRSEFYGAYDVHRVVEAAGSWRGSSLGALAPVDPPVTFGFGSTPKAPAVTSLVTTIADTS